MVWSNADKSKEWLQHETLRALKAWSSNRLLLVTLDDSPLPVGLRDLSATPIRNADDSGTKQLIERVWAIIDPPHPMPQLRLAKGPYIGSLILCAMLLIVRENFDIFHNLIGLVLCFAIPLGSFLVLDSDWLRGQRDQFSLRLTEYVGSQVFVSYSHDDGQTVEKLVEQIEQVGYTVWIDRKSAGLHRYADPIVRAIRTSRLVALMCSRSAFSSDHVIREIYFAGDCGKPFILFQLDSTELPDEILYFVSGFPRVSTATIDSQQLRSEITRLLVGVAQRKLSPRSK